MKSYQLDRNKFWRDHIHVGGQTITTMMSTSTSSAMSTRVGLAHHYNPKFLPVGGINKILRSGELNNLQGAIFAIAHPHEKNHPLRRGNMGNLSGALAALEAKKKQPGVSHESQKVLRLNELTRMLEQLREESLARAKSRTHHS